MVKAQEGADSETTRDRIVRAAEQVVREKGLARATTREIADTARCSEGLLYRYFKSKEELFLAVLSERLPALLPALRDLDSRIGRRTVRANLGDVCMAALSFYDQSIPMFSSVFAEPRLLAQHGEWMRITNTGPHRAVEFLADYLRAERELGRIHAKTAPDEAAALLLGACYMRSLARHSNPSPTPTDDRRFVRRVVATLLTGLNIAEPAGA